MRGKIEDDTAILPWVVAEKVVGDAGHLIGRFVPKGAETYLVDQAERTYRHNTRFARKLHGRGNTGRDALYVFMEHWLAGWLKQRHPALYRKLPAGYGWSYSPTLHGRRRR